MDDKPLHDYLEQVEKNKNREGKGLIVVIIALLVLILFGLTGISAYLVMRIINRPSLATIPSPAAAIAKDNSKTEAMTFQIVETTEVSHRQPTGEPEAASSPTREATAEPTESPTMPEVVTLRLKPGQAPPGSMVEVTGLNWPPNREVCLTFFKASQGQRIVELNPETYDHQAITDESGTFRADMVAPNHESWKNVNKALVIAFTTDQQFSAAQELVIVPPSPGTKSTLTTTGTPLPPVRMGALTAMATDQSGPLNSLVPDSRLQASDRLSIPLNVMSVLVTFGGIFIVVALSAGVSVWLSGRQWRNAQNRLKSLEASLAEARREMTKQKLQNQIALDLLEDMAKMVSQTRQSDQKE